jgi:endonuclease III
MKEDRLKLKTKSKQVDIQTILDLLKKAYGRRPQGPPRDLMSVLVETILSQNTSDINSGRAFQSLTSTFEGWEKVAEADEGAIAEVIKSGGLGQIKARRIKSTLNRIRQEKGSFDLTFLGALSDAEALEWLKGLPGVGDKTAGCVLLFGLKRPVLPVDTHIYRVSARLGLIKKSTSLEEAHLILNKLVPPPATYEFHVLMITHGRQTCIAQRPHCPRCILKEICPSFAFFTGRPTS